MRGGVVAESEAGGLKKNGGGYCETFAIFNS